ncbi:DUF1934 family protein [Terrilactibacillus sp. BCM23-1]|uniref:DUF1934 family protein n=1 Tax=Terrilactibacillus tamarindi TaxID=2599694 RepID=A0A6N8CMV7_9BACI|nr:DUF1934 domain-containing protein [Terrilactibacillus tamarindi]MTT30968.1 DUF1934 family protein [Terrilactibacillus tamarindi]
MRPIDKLAVNVLLISKAIDETEKVTKTTPKTDNGYFYMKNDALYVKFDEIDEHGTVHTLIKVSNGKALIQRKGHVSMNQPLVKNEEMAGSYSGPYGEMNTSAKTHKIKALWDSHLKQGWIQLNYELHVQGQYVGHFDLTYQISPY